MKSLSEIDILSKRASRALGFDWGIAEEVGKNIRMLEMSGIPGIKNLNHYYKLRKKNNYEKIEFVRKKKKKKKLEYCPIIAGVNFLDQVRTLHDLKEVKFYNLAFPILFLPFVSRASEVIGKKILLEIDNSKFFFFFFNSIYCNSINNGIVTIGNHVLVKFLENIDAFDEKEWKELYKLSERIFVEENDSLKQSGAGAGLTDND